MFEQELVLVIHYYEVYEELKVTAEKIGLNINVNKT
jgi:hypothetical protein